MTLLRSSSHPTHQAPCITCGAYGSPGAACSRCGAVITEGKRFAPGSVLGSYHVHEVLGEGGMGIVYLATHSRLQRRVAIKVLRSQYSDNEQALRRFFAEARAVNTIEHPNVIDITDFVEQPGSENFYVMELLEGSTLAALMEEVTTIELNRSVAIMTQLASALAAVHDAGVVHRDLKPDNVVLLQRGGKSDFVKLVDFGVAKLVAGKHELSRTGVETDTPMLVGRTHHGTILGTPGYMSPEQATGQDVDYRSDIYSFGVILYLLVTGRMPHGPAPSFAELVTEKLTVVPTRPRAIPDVGHEIPLALDALIMECLELSRDDRPQTIEDVAHALDEIAEEEDWLVYELNVRPVQSRLSTSMPRAATADPARELPPPVPAPAVVEPERTEQPSDRPDPSRKRVWILGGIAMAAVLFAGVVLATRGRGDDAGDTSRASTQKIESLLALADARIAAGRLTGPGGDEALDHLIAARGLDAKHPGVKQRLDALKSTFAQLATQAEAAGSLAEAAAHLQAVLLIDPADRATSDRMTEIERAMLERQRLRK